MAAGHQREHQRTAAPVLPQGQTRSTGLDYSSFPTGESPVPVWGMPASIAASAPEAVWRSARMTGLEIEHEDIDVGASHRAVAVAAAEPGPSDLGLERLEPFARGRRLSLAMDPVLGRHEASFPSPPISSLPGCYVAAPRSARLVEASGPTVDWPELTGSAATLGGNGRVEGHSWSRLRVLVDAAESAGAPAPLRPTGGPRPSAG